MTTICSSGVLPAYHLGLLGHQPLPILSIPWLTTSLLGIHTTCQVVWREHQWCRMTDSEWKSNSPSWGWLWGGMCFFTQTNQTFCNTLLFLQIKMQSTSTRWGLGVGRSTKVATRRPLWKKTKQNQNRNCAPFGLPAVDLNQTHKHFRLLRNAGC